GQAGELALDIEEPDLPEVEELLVEARPFIHEAAVHIVGEMIDVVEPDALRRGIALADPVEIDVVDRALVAIAIDKIDLQAADPFDRGDIELHRPDPRLDGFGPERQRTVEGVPRINDSEGHSGGRRPMLLGKALRKRALLS